MSIDADQPLDFVLWIKKLELEGRLAERLGAAATLGLCPPSARGDGYYPRTFYGQYVSETLDKWIVEAQRVGIHVEKMPESSVIKQEEEKGNTVLAVQAKSGIKELATTHVFHSTGHWTEKRDKSGYQANPGTIFYPANRKSLTDANVFKQPSDIAIIGSSLSAIDAIMSILLNPDVGHLSWDGDTPTYKLLKPGFKVTCYSRRGLFPRARPQSNRDLELEILSPASVAKLQHLYGGKLKLDDVIEMLNQELAFQFGMPRVDVMADIDPFAHDQMDAAKKVMKDRDPFAVLASDVRRAESGDGRTPDQDYVRWYQVIHALFPVARMLYRQFSTEDRHKFDKQYSSAFLWAFAPMPDRSAKVLLAMHKAEALDLHRVDPEKRIEAKGGKTVIPYLDYKNALQHKEHGFTIMTTGLASDFDKDVSPLTTDLIEEGLVTLEPKGEKEASIFMTEDGSFELLDKAGKHSRFHRGVGFFLHAQLWDVQSVPTTVKYASQVGELYFDEVRRKYERMVITISAPKH